jgi:adenine-specific DNA methylase
MIPTACKRLIEMDLPIHRISEHARREKSIRHCRISTLHIWCARRPLAAFHAVACAALRSDTAALAWQPIVKVEHHRLRQDLVKQPVESKETPPENGSKS